MRKYLYTCFKIAVLYFFWCLANYNVVMLDGFTGELWAIITTSDTEYAKGYSHRTFAQVKPGMTEEQVLDMLGEPLARWRPYQYTMYRHKANYISFQYSKSPSSTNYRLRQVYFDNGKVAEVIHYYYLD